MDELVVVSSGNIPPSEPDDIGPTVTTTVAKPTVGTTTPGAYLIDCYVL
jgi:hypothetical protein